MATSAPQGSVAAFDQPRPVRIAARGGASRVRCFEGWARRTSDWDGWPQDQERWFLPGDCAIYFSAPGAASRESGLRIPVRAIHDLQCDILDAACLPSRSLVAAERSEDSANDRGHAPSCARRRPAVVWELHLPAPPHLTPIQAFRHQLTTRNLLAYAVAAPLVGERLGNALIDLWRRLNEWRRTPPAPTEFLAYCEEQGYLRCAENAEHALAALQLAEHRRLRDIGRNAFSHCVGMHHRLDLSPEYASTAPATRAAITCASLEMDLYLARTIRSLGGFLDDDLGPDRLGLSRPARDHLDRFRSFLHAHYVDRLGYFPPNANAPWNKRLWVIIRRDFQALYEYMVDLRSDGDFAADRRLDGGVCILQNIKAFDERHGLTTLRHPLPLLPAPPTRRRRDSTLPAVVSGMRSRRRSTLIADSDGIVLDEWAGATNFSANDRRDAALVVPYERFERQRMIEKLEPAEARKVRWILIYGALQMLNSITQPPPPIADGELASYPLCVPRRAFPGWLQESSDAEHQGEPKTTVQSHAPLEQLTVDVVTSADRSPRISIRPDCDAETAQDYFAAQSSAQHGKISQQGAQAGIYPLSVGTRVRTSLPRGISLRNSVHSSVRSVVGSLGRHGGGNRRHSALPDIRVPGSPLFANVHEGERSAESPERTAVEPIDLPLRRQDSFLAMAAGPSAAPEKSALADFDFDLAAVNGEPILESHQLEVEAARNADLELSSTTTPRAPAVVFDLPTQPCPPSATSSVNSRASNHSSASYLADESAPDSPVWEPQHERRTSPNHASKSRHQVSARSPEGGDRSIPQVAASTSPPPAPHPSAVSCERGPQRVYLGDTTAAHVHHAPVTPLQRLESPRRLAWEGASGPRIRLGDTPLQDESTAKYDTAPSGSATVRHRLGGAMSPERGPQLVHWRETPARVRLAPEAPTSAAQSASRILPNENSTARLRLVPSPSSSPRQQPSLPACPRNQIAPPGERYQDPLPSDRRRPQSTALHYPEEPSLIRYHGPPPSASHPSPPFSNDFDRHSPPKQIHRPQHSQRHQGPSPAIYLTPVPPPRDPRRHRPPVVHAGCYVPTGLRPRVRLVDDRAPMEEGW